MGTPGYFPPEMKTKSIEKDYSFPIDLYSTAIIAFRTCSFLDPLAKGPIPNCYSKELAMIIHKCRSKKPVDRPVLAELVIHPLFRPYITLEPINESKMTNYLDQGL